MTYLNIPAAVLVEKGALHTAEEIANQPALWQQTCDKFYDESAGIREFFMNALRQSDQIILTGAGTSAFVGLSLQGPFFSRTQKITRAVATTDLVSHPKHYFSKDQTPVIISFARSGKSPESCAALELADQFCKQCFHLIITCNADGALAQYESPNPVHVFVLPPDANDKGLAMTGSYTSMLLTALLLIWSDEEEFCQSQVRLLRNIAEKILSRDTAKIRQMAEKNFQRAVFLGSGPLSGTATEAALKLQELTDGQIICKADSYLGFRHGPRAVINNATLVVYFFSNDPYVILYETDMLKAIKTANSAPFHLAITEKPADLAGLEDQVVLSDAGASLHEHFLPVCNILPAQLLAFFKSMSLGLTPDAPSVSGAISRVVEGVTIYPIVA